MSNPLLLCTENLVASGIIQSQNYTKFLSNDLQCTQRLVINGNIRVDGILTLGSKYRFNIIEEKTPSNGIDLNTTVNSQEMPQISYDDPTCTTKWGFEALDADMEEYNNNSVFGYQASKFDPYPEAQTLFGKNVHNTNNDNSGFGNCYFGADVASDNLDYVHFCSVSIGSEASKSHHYHAQDWTLGYRAAAGNGMLYPCSFDQTSIGARSFELGEYNYDCIGIGAQAKQLSMCDFSGTAFGFRAQNFLSNDYSGYWCSAFGSRSQEVFRGEYWTVSFGAHSMIDYDYGSYNVVLGGKAAARPFSGDSNVFIGFESCGLQKISPDTDIWYQTIVGTQALYKHDDETNQNNSNTVVGNRGMFESTTGAANTVFGFEGMHNGTIASNNAVAGHSAMYNNVDGLENVVIGKDAMKAATNGDNNVIVGFNTFSTGSEINDSVLIGPNIGNTIVPGDDSILIGIDSKTDTASNTGAIAVGINATAGTNCVAIGHGSSCTGSDSVVVGKNANDAGFDRCVCLGTDTTASANDQIIFPTGFVLASTATTDGGGAAVPAQVAGYINLKIGGVVRKVPLYPMP